MKIGQHKKRKNPRLRPSAKSRAHHILLPTNADPLRMSTPQPIASTSTSHTSVLAPSDPNAIPASSVPVQGPDFEKEPSLNELLESYSRIGFQASSFGKAVEIVREMVRPRLRFGPELRTSEGARNGGNEERTFA